VPERAVTLTTRLTAQSPDGDRRHRDHVQVRRRVLLAVGTAAVLLCGSAGAFGGVGAGASGAAAASKPVHDRAIELTHHGGREFVRLHANSLRRSGAPTGQLGHWTSRTVLAPNGHDIVLGGQSTGRLYVVNLRSLSKVDTTRVIPRRHVHGVANTKSVYPADWLRPHLVVGYAYNGIETHGLEPTTLWLAHPGAHHATRRIPLHGGVVAQRASRDHTAFIVSSVNHISAARFVVVDRHGRVRSVRLTHINAGYVDPGFAPQSQGRSPAIALSSRHAFVVGARGEIASIDLRTLSVRYHRLPRLSHHDLHGRPQHGYGSGGPLHLVDDSARLLGHHRLLVGESRWTPHNNTYGFSESDERVVNTKHWRISHTLRNVASVSRVGDLYVGRRYNGRYEDEGVSHLEVFRRNGMILRSRRLSANANARVIGNRIAIGNVTNSNAAATALDPRTGRKVGTLPATSEWRNHVIFWDRGAGTMTKARWL
jgi:hypothetical protein